MVLSALLSSILLGILTNAPSQAHATQSSLLDTVGLNSCTPPPFSVPIKMRQTEYYSQHGQFDVIPFLRLQPSVVDTFDGPSDIASSLEVLGDTSPCRWRMVTYRDPSRIPAVIPRAECLTSDPPTGVSGFCVPVMHRVFVLRQHGCLRGMQRFYQEWEDVPVACILEQ